MRIRRFGKEDAKAVSALIRSCLRDVNSKDYPKKVIDFSYDHYSPEKIIENSKQRKIFVATEKDRIMGTASLHEDVVYTVFVDQKYHGQGIGRSNC